VWRSGSAAADAARRVAVGQIAQRLLSWRPRFESAACTHSQNPAARRRSISESPNVIRPPAVAADRDGMAALVIRAIDQDTAHAHVAHFGEGDFLRPIHRRIKARSGQVGAIAQAVAPTHIWSVLESIARASTPRFGRKLYGVLSGLGTLGLPRTAELGARRSRFRRHRDND
jgi:hypothetical protein